MNYFSAPLTYSFIIEVSGNFRSSVTRKLDNEMFTGISSPVYIQLENNLAIKHLIIYILTHYGI